jgi:RecA/RadA recombinase
MARKKKPSVDVSEFNITEGINPEELVAQISSSINEYLNKKYGEEFVYETKVVKTDIRPLDAILGGGLVLGLPVMVTGQEEIGKTTFAWQLIKKLQEQYPFSISLYIDTEGSAYIENPELNIKSRIELMGINKEGVIYCPVAGSFEKIIDIITDVVNYKKNIENKIQKQIPMIIVWDSIADTDPQSLIEDADSPNSVIGLKARTVQFYLGKLKPLLRRNQVMLYLVDQVRANITDAMMRYAKSDDSIDVFGNVKTATSAKVIRHKLRQWIFLVKGPDIFYNYEDVIGWYIDIHVIKSKLAPSGFSIRAVFDKRYGINKFWTEYYFISNLMPFEELIYRKLQKTQPSRAERYKKYIEDLLGIQSSGAYKQLKYKDEQTGEVKFSKSFYERDAYKLYNEDNDFRALFDKIVEQNIKNRILKLFSPEYNDVKEILKENAEMMAGDEDAQA